MSWIIFNIIGRYKRSKMTSRAVTSIGYGLALILLTIIGTATIKEMSNPFPTDGHELRLLLIEAAEDNTKRLSRVDEICERYRLGRYYEQNAKILYKHPPAPQYTVFYIDVPHNISYCPIYKAGSTTWLYNLCMLNEISQGTLEAGEQISTIARRVLPEIEFPEAEKAMMESAKLLVVRHPFERLLSAYRDKLENSVAGRKHGTLHFYRKFGSKIVQKYRDKKIPLPRPDQIIRRDGVAPPAGIEPTWREFVQYLVQTDLANYGDDHWMPYYLYCTPCLVKFDLIAKVETLWRDQIFAIQKLGLNDKVKPTWKHNGGQSDAAKIYFSQLSRDLVEKLYDKFKLDFELFDYSPVDYYKYATSNMT